MMNKIDEFIKQVEEIQKRGFSSEDERIDISNKIMGFIKGAFNKSREEYTKAINERVNTLLTEEIVFKEKCKGMIRFLLSLKEELIARESFKRRDTNFEELKEDAEKHKIESERRKNVAEFKYWGFAIELIDTVRKELKEFKKIQENLKEEIVKLRDDIKGNKKE